MPSSILRTVVCRAAALVLALGSTLAHAGWSLRLDEAAALPVTAPQRSYYLGGVSVGATLALELHPRLDLQLGASYTFLDDVVRSPVGSPASALAALAGVRLKRPQGGPFCSPFAELLGGYVHTGTTNRPALVAGLGVLFRLGRELPVLLGPAARLLFIPRGADAPDFKTRDAAVVSFGLSLELGPARPPAPPPEVHAP